MKIYILLLFIFLLYDFCWTSERNKNLLWNKPFYTIHKKSEDSRIKYFPLYNDIETFLNYENATERDYKTSKNKNCQLNEKTTDAAYTNLEITSNLENDIKCKHIAKDNKTRFIGKGETLLLYPEMFRNSSLNSDAVLPIENYLNVKNIKYLLANDSLNQENDRLGNKSNEIYKSIVSSPASSKRAILSNLKNSKNSKFKNRGKVEKNYSSKELMNYLTLFQEFLTRTYFTEEIIIRKEKEETLCRSVDSRLLHVPPTLEDHMNLANANLSFCPHYIMPILEIKQNEALKKDVCLTIDNSDQVNDTTPFVIEFIEEDSRDTSIYDAQNDNCCKKMYYNFCNLYSRCVNYLGRKVIALILMHYVIFFLLCVFFELKIIPLDDKGVVWLDWNETQKN